MVAFACFNNAFHNIQTIICQRFKYQDIQFCEKHCWGNHCDPARLQNIKATNAIKNFAWLKGRSLAPSVVKTLEAWVVAQMINEAKIWELAKVNKRLTFLFWSLSFAYFILPFMGWEFMLSMWHLQKLHPSPSEVFVIIPSVGTVTS